jgi:hypothetical protein
LRTKRRRIATNYAATVSFSFRGSRREEKKKPEPAAQRRHCNLFSGGFAATRNRNCTGAAPEQKLFTRRRAKPVRLDSARCQPHHSLLSAGHSPAQFESWRGVSRAFLHVAPGEARAK